MIRRRWLDPNFKCRVSEMDGTKVRNILVYGADANQVADRLKSRRIKLISIAPYNFAEWKGRALAATPAGPPPAGGAIAFDSGLWTELKEHLFDLFDGKCAYCEITMLGAYYGDVEHYRPKSSVKEDPGHPGYYWLAYASENYVPACNKCNNSKSNHFPLAPGSARAARPAQVAAEQPLILNPYRLDSEIHLAFRAKENDPRIGPIAVGLTPEGKATKDIASLNRGDLVGERLNAQSLALTDFLVSRRMGIVPNPVISQLQAGIRPFCAASLALVNSIEQIFPGDL